MKVIRHFFSFMLVIFSIHQLVAQDTVNLTEITARSNKKEFKLLFEIFEITDINLIMTENYSITNTRFFYNNNLFSGVGIIKDSNQHTIMSFTNGRLNGFWYDLNIWNGSFYTKGRYSNGLKNGEWINGDSLMIYSKETYFNGLLNGKQKYYTNEYISKGYCEEEYESGKKINATRYFNLNGSLKNENDTIVQDYNTSYKEINSFKEGILLQQNKFRNNKIFEKTDFKIKDLIYHKFRTHYFDNGNIESSGNLDDRELKIDDWKYFDASGKLIKTEECKTIKKTENGRHNKIVKTVKYNSDVKIIETFNN